MISNKSKTEVFDKQGNILHIQAKCYYEFYFGDNIQC